MEITLTIKQSEVFSEVAQTTSYTGAKMDDDANAYERISTVDEDQPELNRFWDESRAEVAQTFIRMLSSEGMDGDNYNLVLNVSVSFDTALLPGMQLGLFSYFVQSITAKWYVFTNKKEAGDFADRGSAILEEVKEKAFFKKKPVRPTYN
ncbi:MAG: hypothetical protein IJ724_09060 [Muribaculaceae bacterium]|nr:hypothetical protein [Muribaculaceae bacterium]